MWLFNLKKHVWYFLNDHFLDDARVYNNVNDLLIAVGFPRGSVVRVFLISHGLFFRYSRLALSPPPEAISVLQGELATHVAPRTPVLPRARSQRAEEPGDGADSSSDDSIPGLERDDQICQQTQLPRESIGFRALRSQNAALHTQIAQNRTERATEHANLLSNLVLRGDIAEIHAELARVHARHSTYITESTRIVFFLFFLYAVSILSFILMRGD
jgi:hypothetical protein